ncbi:MAG: TolC family protein [Deltaproteobacteria bacterium]|nr:TolC family protein [Deltaproteobacteria bacterium]
MKLDPSNFSRARSVCLVLTGILLVWVPEVRAETSLSEQVAVTTALAQNQDLLAAKQLIAEAKGRFIQAGLLPNPELEWSYGSDRSFNNEGEYSISSGFRQAFPVTGRLIRARDVARVDVALAEAEVKNRERLLRAEVLGLYRALQVSDLKSRYLEALHKRLSDVLLVSERRFKVAEVSETDLNLERLELERLDFQREQLKREVTIQRINLNAIFAQPTESALTVSPWRTPQTSAKVLSENIDSALERRPDRALVSLRIDRASKEHRLARAERWEDWTIGFEYSRDKGVFSDPIGNKTDDFLGLSVSVPLPLWNQNEGKIAEAAAAEGRARGELLAFDIKTKAEIEGARRKVTSLLPVLERFETVSVPLAEKSAHTVQKGYAEGLLSITDVLQSQRQLIELRSAQADSILEFAKALTELETALAYPETTSEGETHEN